MKKKINEIVSCFDVALTLAFPLPYILFFFLLDAFFIYMNTAFPWFHIDLMEYIVWIFVFMYVFWFLFLYRIVWKFRHELWHKLTGVQQYPLDFFDVSPTIDLPANSPLNRISEPNENRDETEK